MILKATIAQTAFILKKKEAACVFYILFVMVIYNFIENVLTYQGKDVIWMFQPMKLLLLNGNGHNGTHTLSLIRVYPLLVVCPAGFALAKEYQLGMRVYLVSRLGNFSYQVSKYLSVFLATMIIFTVPFLLEILLNCLSFPLSATGDPIYGEAFDINYIVKLNHYLMKSIYLYSPYLYAVIGTFLFGFVSGLLGVFTVAVSSLIKVKYNVVLFLPVFVTLNLSIILSGKLPDGAPSIKWYDYILLFNGEIKNIRYLAIGILVLVLFSIGTACISGRKDCL